MPRDIAQPTALTAGHKEVREMLARMGHDVEDEVEVGPYTIDCFLRDAWVGVEYDGPHHDKRKQRKHDQDRDVWLDVNAKIIIIRVPHHWLKSAPGRVMAHDILKAGIEEANETANERRAEGDIWLR